MYTSYSELVKDDQLFKIDQLGQFREHLQDIFKRNITMAEAIIHSFALAEAEDTFNSHYFE